jgi:phage-related protein
MGVILFDGKSSVDYKIVVEHPPEYEIPEKEYEVISVPGRNGDVIIDKGSYKNTVRSYDIAVGSLDEDFVVMANRISQWLRSKSGYARLEDSYEPDYYKIAMYKDGASVENIIQHAGRVTINFNRKPQRFLKVGDTPIIVTSTRNITNPTGFVASPIITVKGNGAGVLNVGGYKVTISNMVNSIVIDSELEDCYNGSTNLNMYVTLLNDEFPRLNSGDTSISFSGGITSVEIVPKWWTI